MYQKNKLKQINQIQNTINTDKIKVKTQKNYTKIKIFDKSIIQKVGHKK